MKIGKFELKKSHWVGVIGAFTAVLFALILFFTTEFFDEKLLSFVIGLAIIIGGLPFLATVILEQREARNKETMFLEFSRDLVEGARAGTPISKSIINLRTKDYGALNSYIAKLANQISIGIPVRRALRTFSTDVKSPTISRAITLIMEAERAGGKIETILESVASSVGQIEKLRKERRAAIYNLTVQGYIVFIIFIIIMLVMQFRILPITAELGFEAVDTEGLVDIGGPIGQLGAGGGIRPEEMARAFLFLLLFQGFFAGLVIGKISEGSVKAGIKHSFILVAISLILFTGANVFLG